MNRTRVLAAMSVIGAGTAILLTTKAESQSSKVGLVILQPNAQTTAQTGNIGISGQMTSSALKTSSFQLGTSATAGQVLVSDANGMGSWQSVLGLTLPYSGTTNVPGCAFEVINNGPGPALCGKNMFPSGNTRGVVGMANSPDGVGVFGNAATGVQGVSTTANGNGVSGYASGGADAWGVSGETGTGQAVIGRAGTGLPGGGFAPGTGVVGYSNYNGGNGVWAQSTMGNGVGLLATNTSNTGNGYGLASYTSSNSGTAIRANAVAPTGQTYGVYADVSSSSGTGMYAGANAPTGSTTGMFGQVASPNGAGVLGSNTSNTGNGIGIAGVTSSTSGTAIVGTAVMPTGASVGVSGVSNSTLGTGVFGHAPATTGSTTGVYGLSVSSAGTGVFGTNTSATGSTVGLRGYAYSDFGAGVFGNAFGQTGPATGVTGQSFSDAGYGVHGRTTSPTGTTYAVSGYAASPTGWALYAFGDVGASGVKPFRIDYPTDPENKYLLHFAAESPFPQNFYSGNVVTDKDGYAWVQLPDYFDDVNTNLKYQLTVVDDSDTDGFVQVKVSKKAQGNRFQIRSSNPHIEVSWRVEADRNDRYVIRRRPKDVVEKVGIERGTYQHPELYGQPAEKGINFGRAPSTEAPLSTPALRTSRPK